jgi:hypothetical protein
MFVFVFVRVMLVAMLVGVVAFVPFVFLVVTMLISLHFFAIPSKVSH